MFFLSWILSYSLVKVTRIGTALRILRNWKYYFIWEFFSLQILRKWKYYFIWIFFPCKSLEGESIPLSGMFAFIWDFHISTWEPLETESTLLSGIFAFIWDFRLFHLWTVSKGIRGDRTGEQMSRTHQPSMDQKDFLQLFTEFFESSPNIFQLFINYLNFYVFLLYIPPTSENVHRNIFLPNSRGK